MYILKHFEWKNILRKWNWVSIKEELKSTSSSLKKKLIVGIVFEYDGNDEKLKQKYLFIIFMKKTTIMLYKL